MDFKVGDIVKLDNKQNCFFAIVVSFSKGNSKQYHLVHSTPVNPHNRKPMYERIDKVEGMIVLNPGRIVYDNYLHSDHYGLSRVNHKNGLKDYVIVFAHNKMLSIDKKYLMKVVDE